MKEVQSGVYITATERHLDNTNKTPGRQRATLASTQDLAFGSWDGREACFSLRPSSTTRLRGYVFCGVHISIDLCTIP